jgi:hypothetical protein
MSLETVRQQWQTAEEELMTVILRGFADIQQGLIFFAGYQRRC